MMPYILGEMIRHLAVRLVSTAGLVDMLSKQNKESYNMALIVQNERTIIVNAMILGIAFGAISIWLVLTIKGGSSALVTIAGILISLGLTQQIMSIALDAVTISLNRYISSWNSVLYELAKRRETEEWRVIQNEAEEIFIFPQITYNLPSALAGVNSDSETIVGYLAERRWELSYPQANFYNDDKSLVSFAKYSVEFLRLKLHTYDKLSTIQHRTGTVNPVLFVALGTLIWLLS